MEPDGAASEAGSRSSVAGSLASLASDIPAGSRPPSVQSADADPGTGPAEPSPEPSPEPEPQPQPQPQLEPEGAADEDAGPGEPGAEEPEGPATPDAEVQPGERGGGDAEEPEPREEAARGERDGAAAAPREEPRGPRVAIAVGAGAGAGAVGAAPPPLSREPPPPGAARSPEPDREPEPEPDDAEWSQEVRREHEAQLRAELLAQYRALVQERGHFQRYNLFLQHKIQESLRRKKGLEAAEAAERGPDPDAADKEQGYLAYLAVLEDLRKQEADDLHWFRQEREQLRRLGRQRLARVEQAWRDFQALKRQVTLQAMGRCRLRGGRPAALREVEQLQALEERKEKEMSAVRLENVQLRQSLAHLETRMRAQEDAAEGLHLIDFEQLKIENQTFNEKVEERNEELLKLRAKVSTHTQVVTHVKEKLHFTEAQNAARRARLLELEARVARRRDALTRAKQARDGLRLDNVRLGQRSGLLGREALLRDLEARVDRTEQLGRRLQALKRHHAGLVLSCRGVRQKIREARAFLPS